MVIQKYSTLSRDNAYTTRKTLSRRVMKACRYCSQLKSTQTALNRHIRHSPKCYEAYTRHLARISNVRTPRRQAELLLPDMVDMEEKADSEEVSCDEEGINDHHYEPFQFPESEHQPSPDIRLPTVDFMDVVTEVNPRKPPRFKKTFPGSVARVLGVGQTIFEKLRQDQVRLGENAWSPFASVEEWDLSRWPMTHSGQNAIDQFLKLPIVSRGICCKKFIYYLPKVIDERTRWIIIP